MLHKNPDVRKPVPDQPRNHKRQWVVMAVASRLIHIYIVNRSYHEQADNPNSPRLAPSILVVETALRMDSGSS